MKSNTHNIYSLLTSNPLHARTSKPLHARTPWEYHSFNYFKSIRCGIPGHQFPELKKWGKHGLKPNIPNPSNLGDCSQLLSRSGWRICSSWKAPEYSHASLCISPDLQWASQNLVPNPLSRPMSTGSILCHADHRFSRSTEVSHTRD